MNKKVSIIVPCYNMEKYICKFLDSVLIQKYRNIELIIVNDGSTDNSEKIIFSYKKKLKDAGVELIYIFQENKGLAESMNAGLAVFTGDYLTWCDPDDFFSPNSIIKKVNFLENNPKYGFVRTDCKMFKEEDMETPVYLLSDVTIPVGKDNHDHPERFKEDLFDDIILERNIYITPGCYMVRKEVFLDCIPSRHIYPSKRGQNWQMLLPVARKYKCGFIDEPLHNYVIRGNSMSHTDDSLEKMIIRSDEHEDILKNVIKSIDGIDKKYYYRLIEEKYLNRRIIYGYIYNKNKELMKTAYNTLKKKKYNISDDSRMYMKEIFGYSDEQIDENNNLKIFFSKIKGNSKDKDNNISRKKKVLFISASGGHLSELLQLKGMFDNYDYHIITEKTKTSISLIDKYPNKVSFLIYCTKLHFFAYMFKFPYNCIRSLFLYIKVRPKVIITTGNQAAVPMCYIGKVFGSKIVYIETFANINTKTLTGKIIYPIADLFIVQWESMLKLYPKAVYGGWIY